MANEQPSMTGTVKNHKKTSSNLLDDKGNNSIQGSKSVMFGFEEQQSTDAMNKTTH